MTIPSYLKKGDLIGITCPASYLDASKVKACVKTLHQWGFEVMLGKTVGSNSSNYFSADDESRLEELQAMLDSPEIKAILFGRGGYGMSRIIDRIDFSRFKKNPKWLIGFSDLTVMHSHLHQRINIASIHGPMAGAFMPSKGMKTKIASLHDCMIGKQIHYFCKSHRNNRIGDAKGVLVGGNLAILTHLIGTKSDINTKGKILFIEDVGEHIYQIDRMMIQLKRSGKLDGLKGLIVGGFTDIKDTERPFGKSVLEVIKDAVSSYTYPVAFGFPVSHGAENLSLKIGIEYHLEVTKATTLLREI